MTARYETSKKAVDLRAIHEATGVKGRNLARGLAILSLLFLVPLLAATYWMHAQAEHELARGELEWDSLRARTLAALVEREFLSTQRVLMSIAARPSIRHAWAKRDLAALDRHLREALDLEPSFLFVSAYEPDGTLRAIFPADPIVGQNFAYRDWYRGVTTNWQPYVSEVYRTAVNRNPLVVAIAVPIRDEQGEPSGILMAPYALDQLARRFKALEAGSSGVFYVIDQRGVVATSPVMDPLGEPSRSPELEAASRALAGEEGSGRFRGGNGENFVGYAPVSKLGWAVIYARPATIALQSAADLRRRYRSIASYLVLIYLATVASTAFLVRRQSRLLNANQALNQKLRERERRTRLILDAAHDAFIAMDAGGVITDWSSQAEATFGWLRKEAVGRVLADTIMPSQHREAHKRGLEHFLATGEGPVLNKRIELTALHRNGHEFPVELTISAVRLGQTYVFHAFLHDITERKQAEKELREQKELQELVLGSMGDGVVVANQNGKFLLFNPAAERILGLGATEATPDQWTSYYGVYCPDKTTPYPAEHLPLARAIRGEAADAVELFVRHSNAPAGVWVSVTARPLRNPDGMLRGGVVVFRDVTSGKEAKAALMRAKEEAERVSKFKDQFLSTMSHELRTPLNAILGFSELLPDERYGALNERQRRYIRHIHTSGKHLLSLINDILDLSKIEAGRLELAFESVRVETAFAEVLGTMRPLADKKSQSLSQLAETGLSVRADATRFRQVLMNLVGNAIKFTPEGGRIELAARRMDGGARLEVRDTGPGIPPEEQKRIFEAFYRLRQSDKLTEGTGLGLTITQRLVELHGGQLGLESQAGQGSCFYFSLPVAADFRERPTQGIGSGPRTSEPARILVIEDDPTAGHLIESQLNSAGYETLICNQPQRAVEIAAEFQPNGITLDLLMKPTNGWEVLVGLKRDPRTAGIPVIVISLVDHPSMGAILGADEYLVKPVDKAALLAAVERCLGPQGVAQPARLVLVVEDDAPTREIIAELLSGQDYAVAAAADGAQARAQVAASLPELVILDLLLPKVSGFELLAEWRASPRTADLPVFVLTSKDLSREEEDYLRAHAEYLFRKQQPWQEALAKQVQRVLAPRQLEKA